MKIGDKVRVKHDTICMKSGEVTMPDGQPPALYVTCDHPVGQAHMIVPEHDEFEVVDETT